VKEIALWGLARLDVFFFWNAVTVGETGVVKSNRRARAKNRSENRP